MKVKVKKYKDGSREFTASDDFQRAYVDWIAGDDVTTPLALGFENKGAGVEFVYLNRAQAEKLRDMLIEVLGPGAIFD